MMCNKNFYIRALLRTLKFHNSMIQTKRYNNCLNKLVQQGYFCPHTLIQPIAYLFNEKAQIIRQKYLTLIAPTLYKALCQKYNVNGKMTFESFVNDCKNCTLITSMVRSNIIRNNLPALFECRTFLSNQLKNGTI